MAIPATQMRPGMIIKFKDELHLVFSCRASHARQPARVHSGEAAECAYGFDVRGALPLAGSRLSASTLTRSRWSFCTTMATTTTSWTRRRTSRRNLKRETLGDAVDFLTPNLLIEVSSSHDGKPVGIELPTAVEMTVVETEPGIKSATASSVTKPAKTGDGPRGAGAAVHQRRARRFGWIRLKARI